MQDWLTVSHVFPDDHRRALLVGRVWLPGQGAVLAHVRDDAAYDISHVAPTCSALLELPNPARSIRRSALGAVLAPTPELLRNSDACAQHADAPRFMAPCDLQAIKAVGNAFITALVDRLCHDLASGDAARVEALRMQLEQAVGGSLERLTPGSPEADHLRTALLQQGVRAIDLEAALGLDVDITTKAQPMSAVGLGAQVGIHPRSQWNHSEPEVVLAIGSTGQVKGAALGNDLHVRDFERRSPLLMSRASDNNASCAIGPFIRLFDDDFRFEDACNCDVTLQVDGHGVDDDATAPYTLHASSDNRRISRPPIDLVRQTMGDNHQYPDGLMLFLGTALAPTADRFGQGNGFAHRAGDCVRIGTPQLGTLVHTVERSDRVARWTYGSGLLMRDLARRGVLSARAG